MDIPEDGVVNAEEQELARERQRENEERRGAALLGLERLEPSDKLAAAHRLRERQSTDAGDVVAAICVAPPGFTVDEVPCTADEDWAPGVRKLVVAGRGTRATIYLDGVPDATVDALSVGGASQLAEHTLLPAAAGEHVLRIEIARCSPPRVENKFKLLRVASRG